MIDKDEEAKRWARVYEARKRMRQNKWLLFGIPLMLLVVFIGLMVLFTALKPMH